MPDEETTNPEEFVRRVLKEGKENRRKEKVDWNVFIGKWFGPFLAMIFGILIGKIFFSRTEYVVQPPRSIPAHYSVQYEDSLYEITIRIDTVYYSERPDMLPRQQ